MYDQMYVNYGFQNIAEHVPAKYKTTFPNSEEKTFKNCQTLTDIIQHCMPFKYFNNTLPVFYV